MAVGAAQAHSLAPVAQQVLISSVLEKTPSLRRKEFGEAQGRGRVVHVNLKQRDSLLTPILRQPVRLTYAQRMSVLGRRKALFLGPN